MTEIVPALGVCCTFLVVAAALIGCALVARDVEIRRIADAREARLQRHEADSVAMLRKAVDVAVDDLQGAVKQLQAGRNEQHESLKKLRLDVEKLTMAKSMERRS